VRQLDERDAGDGADDLARFLEDARPAPQVAGVVVGDRQREICEGDFALSHQSEQKFRRGYKLEVRPVMLAPHLVAGGAGKDHGLRPFVFDRLQV